MYSYDVPVQKLSFCPDGFAALSYASWKSVTNMQNMYELL